MFSLGDGGLDLSHELGNSLLLLGGGNLSLAAPLAALGVSEDGFGGGLDNLADGLAGSLLGVSGLGANGGVDLGVEFLHVLDLGGNEALLPLRELLLEVSGVLLLEGVVVGLDVTTENVGLELGSVEGGLGLLDLRGLSALVGLSSLLLKFEAGETLLGVGNEETSISGTLHGTEGTVTGGGANETNIEESLEGLTVLDIVGDGEELTVDLLLSFVERVHLLEVKETAGSEETSGVSSGVVGETSSETVLAELSRGSLGHDAVTREGGEDDLADDLGGGAAHAETVLLGVVLVFVLEDETATGLEVGLSFSSAAVLGLVTGAVSFVLLDFDECHLVK
jgi:hypothetical protein